MNEELLKDEIENILNQLIDDWDSMHDPEYIYRSSKEIIDLIKTQCKN